MAPILSKYSATLGVGVAWMQRPLRSPAPLPISQETRTTQLHHRESCSFSLCKAPRSLLELPPQGRYSSHHHYFQCSSLTTTINSTNHTAPPQGERLLPTLHILSYFKMYPFLLPFYLSFMRGTTEPSGVAIATAPHQCGGNHALPPPHGAYNSTNSKFKPDPPTSFMHGTTKPSGVAIATPMLCLPCSVTSDPPPDRLELSRGCAVRVMESACVRSRLVFVVRGSLSRGAVFSLG